MNSGTTLINACVSTKTINKLIDDWKSRNNNNTSRGHSQTFREQPRKPDPSQRTSDTAKLTTRSPRRRRNTAEVFFRKSRFAGANLQHLTLDLAATKYVALGQLQDKYLDQAQLLTLKAGWNKFPAASKRKKKLKVVARNKIRVSLGTDSLVDLNPGQYFG